MPWKSIPGSRSRVHFLRQVTTPLVEHITSQIHQLSDESLVKSAQNAVKCERLEELKERAERIRVRAISWKGSIISHTDDTSSAVRSSVRLVFGGALTLILSALSLSSSNLSHLTAFCADLTRDSSDSRCI